MTRKARLAIRGKRVVLPEKMAPAAIHVSDGVITKVSDYDDVPAGCALRDAGELTVLPGLVDTHVHINEPGRTEWEGFDSATRAAAAGGVTSLVDMPLNSIPATTTAAGWDAKFEASKGRIWVDTGFHGGVVPGNSGELIELSRRGARGFKCFLIDSGVPEFPAVDEGDLRQALPILKETGLPLLAHAESPRWVTAKPPLGSDSLDYQIYLESRPAKAESEAIGLLIRLCREFAVPTHIVHLSAAEALPLIADARREGLPLTVETCPHYLHFCAEQVPRGATEFKCAPPIRSAANRKALWEALEQGLIDLIASDHSPCEPRMKTDAGGDFFTAWGGIASLQLTLAAVWTEARRRGFDEGDVARWMSSEPAKLAGLDRRKGAIRVGCDADLLFWNSRREHVVTGSALYHRHKTTPYLGQRLMGTVEETFLRGDSVYRAGEWAEQPFGQVL